MKKMSTSISRRSGEEKKVSKGFPPVAGITLIVALILVSIIAIILFFYLQRSINEAKQNQCAQVAEV